MFAAAYLANQFSQVFIKGKMRFAYRPGRFTFMIALWPTRCDQPCRNSHHMDPIRLERARRIERPTLTLARLASTY